MRIIIKIILIWLSVLSVAVVLRILIGEGNFAIRCLILYPFVFFGSNMTVKCLNR